jgi:thioredoxin reductase/bacterioferritin-associated ferredoxin
MSGDAFDVAVVGAGPAGVAAALAARRLGASTLLIDEQPLAGGQVYRSASPAVAEAGDTPGAILRAALADSDVDTAFGQRLWHVGGGFTLHLAGQAGQRAIHARTVVMATGAQERVAPVPGWTLPGVIGLAGATALLKAQRILPGRDVVVAGRGPLLLYVAATILKGGGRVAAIVDRGPRRAWVARPLAVASRPDLVWQGAAWLATVLRHRVPIHSGSAVRRMIGTDRVTGVEVVRLARPDVSIATLDCDAVCAGDGLSPATELSRMLGAAHRFDAGLGGWHVATDADGATDVPGLYACGDGAGIMGAAAAPLRGEIAGRAAARHLGLAVPADDTLHPRLRRAARFGAAMNALAPADGTQVTLADGGTTICRCEGIDRATLDDAIDAGARSLNGLKAATRCGMGPCGGRFCGDAMAAIMAARTSRTLAGVGMATGRPPLRPLPIAAVTAGFDYAAIPFPEPAPL